MFKLLFQHSSKPKSNSIKKNPETEPIGAEDPEIISLTSKRYRLFNNKDFKDSSVKYYNTLSGTAKEDYETKEIKNIDLIKNMETLPAEVLLIINDNLISLTAKKHFLKLLGDKGLFDKYSIALHNRDFSAPPGKRTLTDGLYEAGGGRRNRKRFTKYVRKRRGKKTRKYRNKY